MKRLVVSLLTLISIISYAKDDRKILSYQVERNKESNHIRIKIDEETFNYKIIYGDTLTIIAEELDTKIEKLARDNKIEDVDIIYTGDDLIVEKKHSNYSEEIPEKK